MASTNEAVAALLREYAELLGITGGDPFRARNYERAAKAVAGYPRDIGDLPDAQLTSIPGVGSSIAGKIAEYRRTGDIAAVAELRAKIPPGVMTLAAVPGIGPTRALRLSRDLGIGDLAGLEAALREGRLRKVSGFGIKTDERIRRGLDAMTGDAGLREALRALPRGATEDDIYAALAAHIPAARIPAAHTPTAHTPTSGITATSAERTTKHADAVDGAGRSPELVRMKDLRGDLHTHTDLTDGVASLTAMLEAGEAKGYAYYAVTDHAPNLVMQRMTAEKILAQREEVRALAGSTGMALLHGSELNIAPDGSVDWDEDFLSGFDLCVASVHSHFDQDRQAMTARFVAAAENPCVNVIGHPLTRKLGRRPPVDVDFDALYAACARTGTALEINASPDRMDLPPEHLAAARDAGVKFSIDTDAHSLTDLDRMPYGIAAAWYGGLTAQDVINAWPLDRLTEFVRVKRSRH
ncbi:DNA polymerase/3'-5' exonuclease PolX [Trebonia kvetii]|uniref:DNA polymerase/3'-5' exonuclease PolX n=1 Tax=Trebonia kvetii TaxID=2480626 RepID=A0A6P2BQ52_9ACTN|nr:helix-hairpin-helix domain-containing protein [Trebonia kvetii]TVZ00326.1 DNA polymerase/3'-5' exonuclease PolX [Trebonia kvetii]